MGCFGAETRCGAGTVLDHYYYYYYYYYYFSYYYHYYYGLQWYIIVGVKLVFGVFYTV